MTTSTPWHERLPNWRDITGSDDPKTHGRFATHTKDFEPMYLADKRVRIGPEIGRIVVDQIPDRLQPRPFQLLRLLAVEPDQVVTVDELITKFYGWDEVTANHRRDLLPNIQANMSLIHNALGEELGDSEWGAVRTIFNDNNPVAGTRGYLAVTSL